MKGEHQQSELIIFLKAENKLLRQENKEFKDLNQLNREALKIALSPRENEDQLPALVSLLFQQNSKLLSRTKQLRQQLQQKSCQVLISEQIASASNEHEKYVAAQLKERLKALKKQVDLKHNRIEQLTKQLGKSQEGYNEGKQVEVTVIEWTEIAKVSEKLFKQSEYLRKQIELKGQEIQKLKEQKEDLSKLNLILTRQVNELKAYSCQTTSSMKRDSNVSGDLSKFMKMQSRIAQGSDDQSQAPADSQDEDEVYSNESLSEDYQQSEEKVQSKPDKSKFNLSLNLKQEQEGPKKEKPSQIIPKLQMKKARQIQSLIIKKINNDEKKKSGNQMKDQKYKKYEAQLDQIRKRLGNELILKMRYQKENIFLKKFIAELESRNQLLVRQKSDKAYEKDYEKYRSQYEEQNMETLLDICRDVTMNEKLKAVLKGREHLERKELYSKEI